MNSPLKKTTDPASAFCNSLNHAVSLFSSRRPREALAAVTEVLERAPRNAMALNIAGVCSHSLGRPEEAENYWRRALKENPDDVDVNNNLGILFKETKRFPQAEAAYRRALEIRPDYVDAHANLGSLLKEAKRFPEAEAAYRRAIEIQPDHAKTHNNLGNLLYEAKRFSEAEAAYRRAVAIRPDYPEAHFNLGILLAEMKRVSEAETAYRQALVIQPDHAKAHANLGNLLYEAKRFSEAEAAYRRALEIQPAHATTHIDLGNLLKEVERFAEAETAYRQALAIRPGYADAHYNLGNLLHKAKRFAEAEVAYRQALAIRPDDANAYTNLGNLLCKTKRFPEAEAAYRRALETRPNYVAARWNLGLFLLRMGRFSEGWPLYEVRYDEENRSACTRKPPLDYPQWQGESLAGKSISVHCEQGFGDAIQFVRYVPLLKAMGARHITLICPQPLRALFETVRGADAVLAPREIASMSAHDCWALLLSLPLHFATTLDSIPNTISCVRPTADRVHAWRARLPAPGLRIGLVWKGNSRHPNDRNRSLPSRAALAPLWDVPGVHFVSLQKGQGEDEATTPPPWHPLTHLGSDITDFADSAAIIAQLDLVICVDTAIAHLAGALGKPCWILLPRVSTDWRWLEDRTDSPWYPETTRLFRQRDEDDWTDTILEVAEALHRFAARYCQSTSTPPSRSTG